MFRAFRILGAAALACALAGPAAAAPIRIAYVATDVADPVPGEDRWEYRYFVTGFTFAPDQGFSISFDPALHAGLDDPPPVVNPDWDVVTFQPDQALASDGVYDALALVGGASVGDPFVLTFTWLGGPLSRPGAQPFTVNQYDATGTLTVIDSGTTVPLAAAVPEPGTGILAALGAVAAWRSARARTRRRR